MTLVIINRDNYRVGKYHPPPLRVQTKTCGTAAYRTARVPNALMEPTCDTIKRTFPLYAHIQRHRFPVNVVSAVMMTVAATSKAGLRKESAFVTKAYLDRLSSDVTLIRCITKFALILNSLISVISIFFLEEEFDEKISFLSRFFNI